MNMVLQTELNVYSAAVKPGLSIDVKFESVLCGALDKQQNQMARQFQIHESLVSFMWPSILKL